MTYCFPRNIFLNIYQINKYCKRTIWVRYWAYRGIKVFSSDVKWQNVSLYKCCYCQVDFRSASNMGDDG